MTEQFGAGNEKRRAPRSAGIDFAFERFKGQLAMEETDVTVGTSAVEVLNNRPDRVAMAIVNHGGSDVYLSTRESAGTGKGFIIGANGGSILMNVLEDGMLVAWQWWAISTAAGISVTVFESWRAAARKGN